MRTLLRGSWLIAALLLNGIVGGQSQTLVLPLWPEGAPGFEDRKGEPERAESYWVRNVHQPTLTVFLPPKEKATGVAVLVCPGGGHRELVFNAEGVEPARHLAALGVAAFALKYRLAREEGSPYQLDLHPRQDAERAMRLIRTRAVEWQIDPSRIGAMGFSAGGEVVSLIAYGSGAGNPRAKDLVEQANSRPDFQVLVYPGPLGLPDVIPSGAPPAFFIAADDDRGPAQILTVLTHKYRTARVPVEFHLLARGGHAFNMGTRSPYAAVKSWPQRLDDWLMNTVIRPPAPKPAGK